MGKASANPTPCDWLGEDFDGCRVGVGRLPDGCMNGDLRRGFRQFGLIVFQRVLRKGTDGFGVVVFDTPASAEAAVAGSPNVKGVLVDVWIYHVTSTGTRSTSAKAMESGPQSPRFNTPPPSHPAPPPTADYMSPEHNGVRLVVKGVAPGCTPQHLRDAFSDVGPIRAADVLRRGPWHGCGVVVFRDARAAALACSTRRRVCGHEVEVSLHNVIPGTSPYEAQLPVTVLLDSEKAKDHENSQKALVTVLDGLLTVIKQLRDKVTVVPEVEEEKAKKKKKKKKKNAVVVSDEEEEDTVEEPIARKKTSREAEGPDVAKQKKKKKRRSSVDGEEGKHGNGSGGESEGARALSQQRSAKRHCKKGEGVAVAVAGLVEEESTDPGDATQGLRPLARHRTKAQTTPTQALHDGGYGPSGTAPHAPRPSPHCTPLTSSSSIRFESRPVLARKTETPSKRARSAAFSPTIQGQFFLSSMDGSVSQWQISQNTFSLSRIATVVQLSEGSRVDALAPSPCGAHLALLCNRSTMTEGVRLWACPGPHNTPPAPCRDLFSSSRGSPQNPHPKQIKCLAWVKGGTSTALVTGGEAQCIVCWQLSTADGFSCVPTALYNPHTAAISSVASSLDGSKVFSTGYDGRLCETDLNSGSSIELYRFRRDDLASRLCAVSPSPTCSSQLALSEIARKDGQRLVLWDIRSPGAQDLLHIPGSTSALGSPEWSPCGRFLSLGLMHGKTAVYDVRNRHQIVISAHKSSRVYSTAWCPGLPCLVTMGGPPAPLAVHPYSDKAMFLGWSGWDLVVMWLVGHFIFKVLTCFYMHVWMTTPLKSVYSPPHNFLWGCTSDLVRTQSYYHDWRVQLFKEAKSGTVHLPLAAILPVTLLYTADPKVVRHILKDKFDNWSKIGAESDVFFLLFQQWIGYGIFHMKHGSRAPDSGALWHSTRKVAAAIFTKRNFQDQMREVFVSKAHLLLDAIEKQSRDGPVDMQQKFFAFTMDSVMQIFFGRETETIRDSFDAYANNYDAAHRNLMLYFFKHLPLLSVVDLLPFPLGPLHPLRPGGLAQTLHLRLSRSGSEFLKAVKELERVSRQIVRDKAEHPDLERQTDLLALFMRAKIEEGVSLKSPDTQKYLRDVVLNFIIAGRDTTACTLTWTFYLLATHPEIQQRVCEEVDDALQGADPTYDTMTVNNLPYLNGVIYEALRLYPPVPEDAKTPYCEDTLPNGITVRPGTQVYYVPYSMGRDETRYDEPLQFRPERWIPFKEPDPYEFPVFQAGPRMCLGQKMALFESRLLTYITYYDSELVLTDNWCSVFYDDYYEPVQQS